MTHQEKIELIIEKTYGMRTAMLVTMNDVGHHIGRPMSTQEINEQAELWFMTSKESRKVQEIQKNNTVGVMYGDGNGVQFVSLSGTAEIVDDTAKIKELWTPFYKAWFDDENDPSIVLIKVVIQHAECWDYRGGKMGAYFDMAKSAVTGKMADNGEYQSFDL